MILVECDISGDVLGRFGFPLEIRLASHLDFERSRRLMREVFGLLTTIGKTPVVQRISIRSSQATDPDGLVASLALKNMWFPKVEFRAVAKLDQTDEQLLQDLRKGHRQQVQWGQHQFSVRVVDRLNPVRELFDSYRQFHAHVAGRVTRSVESWDVMFAAIAKGQGDLVLGWLDNNLVCGTLVMDAEGTAYYASGVYDRERFDKPLAHYPLFLAMKRARERGCHHFDFGEVPFYGSASEKEVAIGYFKKGFTSRVESYILWTYNKSGGSQFKSLP